MAKTRTSRNERLIRSIGGWQPGLSGRDFAHSNVSVQNMPETFCNKKYAGCTEIAVVSMPKLDQPHLYDRVCAGCLPTYQEKREKARNL